MERERIARVDLHSPRPSSAAVREMAEAARTQYVLIQLTDNTVSLGYGAEQRLLQVADSTGAVMVYADFYETEEGQRTKHPVIDYQEGALRDDFDFGPLVLVRTDAIQRCDLGANWLYGGWYDLRLQLSRQGAIFHLNEYLYTEEKQPVSAEGERQFDYVDPRNRAVQIEMERVCTDYLKTIGAWLPARTRTFDASAMKFDVEASVVIPVYNRARTIGDAVRSALGQETDFPFNVIVVDNHSTDGTTDILKDLSSDGKLIHLIPKEDKLGIGGCWNVGIFASQCGKYAVQLDSDDVYKDKHTLQRIIDMFHREQCAMVVGSYIMTDFDMQVIPPGIIDHREWTDENGHNNALRINGLGAPRAFCTELLRKFTVPNTSYGEDYALGLMFSRSYKIGRIYEPIYLCRRWEGNSDAALVVEKINANNSYKDKLRSFEIEVRKKMNER